MADQKTIYVTKNAHDKLKAELDELEGPLREEIIEAIATARAHGDLSENAEYHAAKDQQGLQESRVRQIRQTLENSEIVEAHDDGVISPGMVVTIRHHGDDETETYLFGMREEKGGEHDILTPESPLGRALLGHSAGETIGAEVPSGSLKVEIVEVHPA